LTEQKKNKPHFIIPATFFRKLKGSPTIAINEVQNVLPEKISEIKEVLVDTEENSKQKVPALNLSSKKKGTSGLSLKSIRAKKDHKIKQMDVVLQPEDLPKESFTEDNFKNYWNKYNQLLDQKGLKIVASIMQSVMPDLDGTTIKLEFPNESMKIDLEREQHGLMEYMRRHLKNHDLTLHISVNEEIANKHAYTDEEKLIKLMDKNPSLKLLKETFNLEI
jgi:DNA polymerase-3 subunit gamma/tau